MALSWTPTGSCPAYDANGFCVNDPLRNIGLTPNPSNPSWFNDPIDPGQAKAAGLPNAISGQQNAAAAQENAFGLGNMFDDIVQGIPILGPVATQAGGAANAASGLYTTGKAAVSFLAFLADLPRLGTTLLGLILIIAGIFALTKGPVVGIVGDVAKEALVS